VLPPRLPLSAKDMKGKRRNSITCIQPYKKKGIDELYEYVMETGLNTLGLGVSSGRGRDANQSSTLRSGGRTVTIRKGDRDDTERGEKKSRRSGKDKDKKGDKSTR
jgi:hypothetical protein